MTSETKLNIFLVDDDALFLKSLEIQFRRHYTQSIIETYPSGELCIQHISQNPDIIFLDYYLNGIDKNAMNGMQTLDKIRNINPVTPVVLLSSQDSIDIAVTCMHHKAFDYIVKSETSFLHIQKIISSILSYKKIEDELKWYMQRM